MGWFAMQQCPECGAYSMPVYRDKDRTESIGECGNSDCRFRKTIRELVDEVKSIALSLRLLVERLNK